MREELREKVSVVTGASSGIGRRTALDLARRGAIVCAVARREDRLREVVAEMDGGSRRHSYVRADVSSREDVRALARHVDETYGRCDVLVNNAGFSRRSPFDGPDAIEDLEAVMRTNFFGTVYCTAEFLHLLARAAPSVVVNVASVAGRLAALSSSAYCASKFAVVGWSESVRVDLARRGIHLATVEPAPIPTEGFPQKALVANPLLRLAVGSDGDVSEAIQDAIVNRRYTRTVPRWYYLLRIPAVVAPPVYRAAQRQLVGRLAPRGGVHRG